MNGIPASANVRFSCSAVWSACFSDSMTQGPAITTMGFPPPMDRGPILISRVCADGEFVIRFGLKETGRARQGMGMGSRGLRSGTGSSGDSIL